MIASSLSCGSVKSKKDLAENLPAKLSDSEKLNWLIETMRQFLARNTNPLPPNYDARFAALSHTTQH
jgi:hypothetical protein